MPNFNDLALKKLTSIKKIMCNAGQVKVGTYVLVNTVNGSHGLSQTLCRGTFVELMTKDEVNYKKQ